MNATPIRSKGPAKTWSVLGEVRRKPSPYEIVTADFHYHFRREPAPFDLDPKYGINDWYLRYREGSSLQVPDWRSFRDPDKLTYRAYVELQHQRETIMDGVIDEHERRNVDAGLSPEWGAFLIDALAPVRFASHCLQMTALYVGQLSPTAYITNAAHFQAGDELRRCQWTAYRCKSLSLHHSQQLASSEAARAAWEDHEAWQPARKLLEQLLIAYDWGEAVTALNLVVKPVLDSVINEQLAVVAEANGDLMLASVNRELAHDSERSQRWTASLVACARAGDPANTGRLQEWVSKWSPAAYDAADALLALYAKAPAAPATPPTGAQTRQQHAALLAACGLGTTS